MDYYWFPSKRRQYTQNMINDTLFRPPVTSTQCIIGTEKSIQLFYQNYDDDDYNQGYGHIEEAFKALTKDEILQPYINDNDFRSSNNNNGIGCNLYVFDIRCHKNFKNAQPIKVDFKSSENIDAGTYAYALVLTNKRISISSDGQRPFDLIQI